MYSHSDKPATTARLCVGREEDCLALLDSSRRQGAALFFGGRQCGKTSVLTKVSDDFCLAKGKLLTHLPVYINLMTLSYDAGPGDVFVKLAKDSLERCLTAIPGFPDIPLRLSRSSSLEDFIAETNRILTAAPSLDLRLVWLLDEAKRIFSHRFPRGFLDNLFAILYGDSPIAGRISMIFAGAQDLYELCQDGTSPIASRAAFHFLGSLDASALSKIVSHYNPQLGGPECEELATLIYRMTGGQASLSVAIACETQMLSDLRVRPQFVSERVRQRHVGLLRVWAESLSDEAGILQRILLVKNHEMELTTVARLFHEYGKDPFLVDKAREELCYTGIATFKEGSLSLTNAVYAEFAAAFVVEDPGSELERSVWGLIENTELSLRRLVRKVYAERWGVAADSMIEMALGPEAWQRIQGNRDKATGGYKYSRDPRTLDILEFTYLGQLHQLMIWNKAWGLFESMFRDKREIGDIIADIMPVRNEEAHFRRAPARELERCKLRCQDLIAIIEQHHPAETSE